MNDQNEVMECSEIQRMVWTEGPAAAPAAHLQDCAACREHVRRAADVQAALAGMRVREADVPQDLYASIVAAVSRGRLDRARGIVSHPRFWKGAAVAGAAATAVAGILVARRYATRPEAAPSLVA